MSCLKIGVTSSFFREEPEYKESETDKIRVELIEDDLHKKWSKPVEKKRIHEFINHTVKEMKDYQMLLRSKNVPAEVQKTRLRYVASIVTRQKNVYFFALTHLIAAAGRSVQADNEVDDDESDGDKSDQEDVDPEKSKSDNDDPEEDDDDNADAKEGVSKKADPKKAKEKVKIWRGNVARIPQEMLQLLNDLEDVGLGGSRIEKAWSEAVNILLGEFVAQYNTVEHPLLAPCDALADLLQRCFVFSITKYGRSGGKPMVWRQASLGDAKYDTWVASDNQAFEMVKAIALDKMGRGAAVRLCKKIVGGDSLGAELDGDSGGMLQQQFTAPGLRDKNAKTLQRLFQRQVLHSGNSTTFVLRKFVNAVRTLHQLGTSSVFVDRVAKPIQDYLRSREDAVRIVILSLLEDVKDDEGKLRNDSDNFCGAVASCMTDRGTLDWQKYYDDMDLEDLEWQPEPLEAGPEYLSTKVSDTVSYLINISPQSAFVTQLKAVLAARLLQRTTSGQTTFTNEIALLNLFKQRFGEIDTQACEVMIRDVLSSQQLNANIEHFAKSNGTTISEVNPKHGTIVVSQHYWSLPQQISGFTVPASVEGSHRAFNDAYANLKLMRKVQYLNELGKVKLKLQLDDRTIETECTPAQATIIHSMGEDSGKGWTLKSLMEKTNMSETLARQCLAYWQVSRVIEKISKDAKDDDEAKYFVLERLPTDSIGAKENAPPMSPPNNDAMAPPPIKRPEDILNENKELYSRFVVGMLTNQGAMDEKRIHMMLKMALPGGFPFEAALMKRHLLLQMEKQGVIELQDGVYWRIKKA